MTRKKHLVYSADREMIDIVSKRLAAEDRLIATAMSTGEAAALLDDENFETVTLVVNRDLDDILGIIGRAVCLDSPPACLVIDRNADLRTAVESINAGCSYFIDSMEGIEKISDTVESITAPRCREKDGRRESTAEDPAPGPAGGGQDPSLSRRENEILFSMLQGLNNREISQSLGISEKTVKNHLWKIYRKFQVENRTQLFHRLLSGCPCIELACSGKKPAGSVPALIHSR